MRGFVEMQRPQTVAEQVANVLREAIADGSLAAGTALRQDELALRFGFSRMPIRDALRQLEAEGIVQIHPIKGASVASIDATELREVFALRILLEKEALTLSVPTLASDKLDEAAEVLARIDAEPDAALRGGLNRSFHLLLYSACGNARLLGLIEAHHNAADSYVRMLQSSLDYRGVSQAEHRDLLAACRKRDTAEAVRVLDKHLSEAVATLAKAGMLRKA